MTFDFPTEFEATARHYARLARDPRWRDYSKTRVLELEAADDCWSGLLNRVREILKEKN